MVNTITSDATNTVEMQWSHEGADLYNIYELINDEWVYVRNVAEKAVKLEGVTEG